ncbi:uncharacterized protein LOC144098129 [Amblyomma americanum]
MQVGFRRGLCAQDILRRLHNDVLAYPSSAQLRVVVGVDVKKAFDSVPHSTILQRLQEVGIGGNLYRFVKAFLADRTFSVMVGDTQGARQPNRTGVPQDAVISPALFNIAMSGLPPILTSIPGLNFAVYADDITLCANSGSPAEQELALQTGLNAAHDYIKKCGMKTSPEKTEYVAFCPVEDLHACCKINALQDVAEQHFQAQRVRLSTTAAGRQILRALGYNTDKLELLSSPAPPWELIDLVEGMPLPKNMSSANSQRRKAAAKRHEKMSHKLAQEGAIQLYTDAAQFQLGAAIACHDYESDTTIVERLSEEHTVTNLELIAIRLDITRIVDRQDPAPCTYHVYTDSQAAYTACRAGGADYAVLSAIRTEARRLREEGYTIVIRWIPAHEGITGNEKAHQAARAAALSAPLPGCTLVSAS